MILRVVNGVIPPGELNRVVDTYRRDYVPIAAATSGLDRYVIAGRTSDDGSVAFAAMTLWASIDAALAAYDGNLTAIRTIDGRTHGETLTSVDYYEVDAEGARRRDGTPTLLRLTAGTVARGLDSAIQQELRERLPDLPDDVLEAFVGRRVQNRSVEIALVTTWSDVPAGRDLGEPIWPAISNRYDSFRIDLHDVLLDGTGAG